MRVENLRAAVERADPGRSAHFVSGEGQEIAADFLHIDRQMARALRRSRPASARRPRAPAAKIGDGIDRA